MIRFRCPRCDARMEVDDAFAGRPARCATCGNTLRVPKVGEATPPIAGDTPSHPDMATVKIQGERVEVLLPLEPMVVLSLVFVGLSAAATLALGLGRFVRLPWTLGMTLGAALALLGAMTAVPGYHNVRRSRGRKRGRGHALAAMLVGSVLFLVFTIGAIVGFTRAAYRPPCEENLQRIYAALREYAGDHGGAFPDSLDELVRAKYLDAAYLVCPQYTANVPAGESSYILTPQVDLQNPLWPSDMMIVNDGQPHPDGYFRVLLLDGTLKQVPDRQFLTYRQEQWRRWNDVLNRIRRGEKAPPGTAAPDAAAPDAAPAPAGTSPAGPRRGG